MPANPLCQEHVTDLVFILARVGARNTSTEGVNQTVLIQFPVGSIHATGPLSDDVPTCHQIPKTDFS